MGRRWCSDLRGALGRIVPVATTRGRSTAAAICARRGPRCGLTTLSGWLNVRVDGESVLAESAEQAGPTWGMGQRSFAVSPDSSHVALCRNEGGFGRLVVVDRSSGRVTNVGKGGHGQLTWVGDTLVALRSGAVTPTQIVAYDLSDLSVKPSADGARRRPGRRVGPIRPARALSDRGRRLARPSVRSRSGTDARLGARGARPTSGRPISVRASRTGGAADGTSSWSTRTARPATAGTTSVRSTDNGVASTWTTQLR